MMAGATGATLCAGIPAWASPRPFTETRAVLGTYVTITVANVSEWQAQEGLERAFAKINQLSAIFSRYDASTPIAELNRTGILRDAPQEVHSIIARARRMTQLSNGAFDITVQPIVNLFQSHRTEKYRLHIEENILRETRALVGMQHLQEQNGTLRFAQEGMGITLDGIAKGAIADSVSTELSALGITDHLINAGGDIVARGRKNVDQLWRVAVASPSGQGYAETLSITQGAIATSGSYEIYYDASQAHHHLITPSSGRSPHATKSVSVMAPTAIEADALATALSVMPAQDAIRLVQSLPNRSCMILTHSGQKLTCPRWNRTI